jgi:hypothetical protein
MLPEMTLHCSSPTTRFASTSSACMPKVQHLHCRACCACLTTHRHQLVASSNGCRLPSVPLAAGDWLVETTFLVLDTTDNLYAYTIVPVDVALTNTSPGSHVQRSITALVQRLQAGSPPLIPPLRPDYGPTTLVTGGNLVSITNQPGSVRRPTDCEPVDYSEPTPSTIV